MNATERQRVRRAVLRTGFDRIGATEDDGEGRYSETWRHADGTTITIEWEKKDRKFPLTRLRQPV